MRIFILLFSFITLTLSAQKTLEAGLSAGMLYYLGDINTSTQFASYNPELGIFVRQNLNKRWSIKLSGMMGTLSADDKTSNYKYQQKRNKSFQTSIFELVPQFEFNFLPYKIGGGRGVSKFTPYLASGLGFLLVRGDSKSYQITIPMSLGLKLSINDKAEIGVNWSFRKTFFDDLDNLSSQKYDLKTMYYSSARYKQNGFGNDDDWYAFAEIFIVYKIFDSWNICNAYDF